MKKISKFTAIYIIIILVYLILFVCTLMLKNIHVKPSIVSKEAYEYLESNENVIKTEINGLVRMDL